MSAGDARGGAGHAARHTALYMPKTSENLNVTAVGGEVKCTQVIYDRCAPLGITDLLIERAKREPPAVRLALVHIWRVLMAKLGIKPQSLEERWVNAELDPNAVIGPEDRVRAEAIAEEALAPCRICMVDLATFFQLVRRVTLASRPNGDLTLIVEVELNGDVAVVATKLSAWVKQTKEGIKHVVPLAFRENLRRLGLEVDADPRDLYLELFRRAEHYSTVPDAYLKPIILQILEKLKAAPFLARCRGDGRVIYIAAELFRTALWYFDSHVGLGRNQLYNAFRRHGLLASSTSVSVVLFDEYGRQVKKRAWAFFVDRLSEFAEYSVDEICRAAAGLVGEAAESGEEQPTPLSGGYA
jgi:hypothetical protein